MVRLIYVYIYHHYINNYTSYFAVKHIAFKDREDKAPHKENDSFEIDIKR